MSEQRFTVVGGGLAGLMTTIKLAEAGHEVDLFSLVPVKRSHSVCAQGGINGAVNTKGEGDSPGHPLRRHGPAAATSSPTSRREGRCATRRRASSTCSTAWACRSTARRRACSTSAASAARCTTAPRSPAPPPASSCSTRSTSRCAATRSTGKVRQVRVLGVRSAIVQDDDGPLPRHRRHGPAHHGARRLPGRRGDAGDRRPGHRLRQVDQLDHQHRHRRRRAPTSRARSTPTASSSRCTRRPSPARTSCG